MSPIKMRWILRWDSYQRKYRVLEFNWYRGTYGKGGYAARLTLSIRPRLLGYKQISDEWWLSLPGIQWHYNRHYGSASI